MVSTIFFAFCDAQMRKFKVSGIALEDQNKIHLISFKIVIKITPLTENITNVPIGIAFRNQEFQQILQKNLQC